MSASISTSDRIFTTSTTAPLTTPSPATETSFKPSLHTATEPKPVTTTKETTTTKSSTPTRSSSPTSSSSVTPVSVSAAELATSYKWDSCVENSLVKTGYGLVGAGLLSLLLFRSPAARAAMIGVGAGFGAGISWVECKQTFATNSPIKPKMSKFQLPIIQNETTNTKSSIPATSNDRKA